VVQWAVDAVAPRAGRRRCASTCAPAAARSRSPLANELPARPCTPVERDPDALAWTRRNAATASRPATPRCSCTSGSAEDALPELDGQLDLVISNPPYVATTEAHIPDPRSRPRPRASRCGPGEDGLDVIRLVEQAARRLLKPGGPARRRALRPPGRSAPALLEAAGGWAEVADHQDYAGRDRYVTARWTGAS
jgi:release factor glutamine methyltransferase